MARKKQVLEEDHDTVSVEAVNYAQGVVLVMRDDTPLLLPITNYFDAEANEVEGYEGAACFVAGNADCWITVPIEIFEDGTIH